MGQVPARFEIQKMRLLYLKYILDQIDDSLLKKFFSLQMKNEVKNSWASTCLKDLKELKTPDSLDEIKIMKKNKFKEIWKEKV